MAIMEYGGMVFLDGAGDNVSNEPGRGRDCPAMDSFLSNLCCRFLRYLWRLSLSKSNFCTPSANIPS